MFLSCSIFSQCVYLIGMEALDGPELDSRGGGGAPGAVGELDGVIVAVGGLAVDGVDGRGPAQAQLQVHGRVVPGTGSRRRHGAREAHHLVAVVVEHVERVVHEQLVLAQRALLLGRLAADLNRELLMY